MAFGNGCTTSGVEVTRSMEQHNIFDTTIIGGGPVGLFAAFYAGMRGLKTKIIDSLPELGGQLIAVYPEKYIYDVAGFPKILAKDYVRGAVEQALSTGAVPCLGETALSLTWLPDAGYYRLTTDKAVHYTRTLILCVGIGSFEPKRLDAPGIRDFESRGITYLVRSPETFQNQDIVIVGGGDSAVDWALALYPIARSTTLVHRSKFRAHEHSVHQLHHAPITLLYPFWEVKEVRGSTRLEEVVVHQTRSGETKTLPAQALIVAIGFAADLGPLKSWGLTIDRNSIVVDPQTMSTGLPGVFAAGDVVTYPGKFKLIATGVAEAISAVNHAVVYLNPSARLDAGHSTAVMEKRERAALPTE